MKETKFKQTEVGMIPWDWEVKELGNEFTIVTGSTPPTNDPKNYGDDFLFVSPMDLGSNKNILSTEKKLSVKGFSVSRPYPEKSILFTCIGSTIGKCGIASCVLTSNQQINAVFPNEKYSPDYMYYVLLEKGEKIRSLAGCQAVPLINKSEFAATLYQVPPTIEEQQRIANALSDVDSLISNLEKLIAKKKNIKQGAMQQLLTGRKRLPGFKEDWCEKQISKIGFTYTGLSGKTASDFNWGNALYVTFLNVLKNPIIDKHLFQKVNVCESENQNAVLKGDLLFNTSSEVPEEVGICSVLKDYIPSLYLNSFCFGFRLTDDEIEGLFLSYYFRSTLGRNLMSLLAQGSTRYNLSKDNFLKSKILMPSSKAEQTAIANVLSDMDSEIQTLETKLAKYRKLKTGMMQQLLTGKIRLV